MIAKAWLLQVFQRLPWRAQRFATHRMSPLYSLGALAVVLDNDHILLVRHSYREGWGLPGGLSKRGEAPEDTARRETLEEVGLRIDLIGEPSVDVGPYMRKVDVLYLAKLAPGVQPCDMRPVPPEISECRWFALDSLPDMQDEVALAIARFTRLGVYPG